MDTQRVTYVPVRRVKVFAPSDCVCAACGVRIKHMSTCHEQDVLIGRVKHTVYTCWLTCDELPAWVVDELSVNE